MGDLTAEMERLRLRGVMVRHKACVDVAPYLGNRMMMDEIGGAEGIWPVWCLTSDGSPPAFDPAQTVRDMLAAGVWAGWIMPVRHDYSPAPWCSGELYEALQAARAPLLVSWEQVGTDVLYEVCGEFPELRVILLDTPRIGRIRRLWPLLKRRANVFVCFHPRLSVAGGFRRLCDDFGPHRWVLGAGYPACEGGAGIAGLMYAGLTEEEVAAVASGTILRLREEVRRDVL